MDHCERSNDSPWNEFMFPEFEELLVDDAIFDAFIGDEPTLMTGFDNSSETDLPSRFTELDNELDLANEPQTAPSAHPVSRDGTTDPEIQQAAEPAIPPNEGTALGPRRYCVLVIYWKVLIFQTQEEEKSRSPIDCRT
jgi:hypothetical protein